MTPETALDLGRQAMILALTLALPMLCVGLVVGIIVAIAQAVTQIQEMTLTFVPKIIAMVLAGIFFMPYLVTRLTAFAAQMFGPMPVP